MFKRIEDVKKNIIKAGEKASIQILLGPGEMPNFAMRKFTIEVGGSIPLHINTLEHEQYVLKGRGKIVLGEETKEVTPGSVVYMPEGMHILMKTLVANHLNSYVWFQIRKMK